MSSRHQPSTVSRSQGALAWMLAGLVFALGLLTVSPAAHAHLHGHDTPAAHDDPNSAPAHDDSGCAVTLFQQGLTAPLDLPRLDTPRILHIATVLAARTTPAPRAPLHLLQPVRGPPRIG